MFCFCVFSWNENCVPVEVEMLDLNLGKLTYPAAQLVNCLKHELVAIVVNSLKELLKLVESQVSYDLTKPLVFSGTFAGSAI